MQSKISFLSIIIRLSFWSKTASKAKKKDSHFKLYHFLYNSVSFHSSSTVVSFFFIFTLHMWFAFELKRFTLIQIMMRIRCRFFKKSLMWQTWITWNIDIHLSFFHHYCILYKRTEQQQQKKNECDSCVDFQCLSRFVSSAFFT